MRTSQSGFTLIELVVSITIFAILTALVVARYGTFNQSVLLSNLAYDVAGTLRTAQTYGLSVKSTGNNQYNFPYGVHFDSSIGNNNKIIMFSDSNIVGGNKVYDPSPADLLISTYNLKRGALISGVCVSAVQSCTPGTGTLDITFKRPDPNAIICFRTGGPCSGDKNYAKITLTGTDGSTRNVVVRENGQISVED